MPSASKYDVAITAADFDALAVADLKRRLTPRLARGVHVSLPVSESSDAAAERAAVRKAIEKEARVVVVLFQRLWGATPHTAPEAEALRARIGKVKHKDVLIVPVDTSPMPSWLKGVTVKATAPASSAVVDAIVDAVAAAGGSPKRLTDAARAEHHADEERRSQARTSFLSSQRALTLINRELDSLSAAVLRLCETPGTLPEGVEPAIRRTPDRYTVQIGPVGLSFSWIRGRSSSIAEGQLLVIEWSGQLGEQQIASETAMPAFEHVLQPQATSPEDWAWRRSDLDLCCYTSKDLAAQCVTSIVRRLGPTVSSASTASSASRVSSERATPVRRTATA